MKSVSAFAITMAVFLCGQFTGMGEPFLYQFIFIGKAYQTNASGNIVGTPITDQTFLQDRARQGNITDLSTIAIAYHINGNSLGDTVEIISSTNGQLMASQFGLYFGSDAALGRTAVTNALQTAQKRVDYIYTGNNSTYTFDDSHSVGVAMTSKSVVTSNGTTNAVISGVMSWGVAPQGTNGPILCIGSFSLGRPLF